MTTTHISNPEDLHSLEKVFDSKGQTTLLSKSPATISYYDIQRLVYLQKQSDSSKLLVRFPYRVNSEIQGLYYKLKKTLSEGTNTKINSITIHSTRQPSQDPSSTIRFIVDQIDLILYLSSQNATAVQGFSEEPTEESESASIIQHLNDQFTEESTHVSFTLVAGTLSSGGSFSLHIGTQNTGKCVSNVQVSLSNGEVFSTAVSSEPDGKIGGDTDSEVNYGNIEDVAKALRIYRCAVYSLDTAKKVTIKHNGDKLVPIRIVGTAEFLKEGLFLPSDTNRKVAVSGIFSKNKDKVKEIFNKQTMTGEPFEYIPSSEVALSNPFSSDNWRPMFYIPSIPGTRKDQEMLDALKAGYVVLAEKPAFANAEQGKNFLKKLEKEQQKRLFFGWHYVQSYTFKRVMEDVKSKKFGKVKHVRTFFSVPKLLADSRIFDPTQGGVGLDVYSYNLHYVLRVVGFDQDYEIVQSKIKSAQYLDPSDPKLARIDFTIDSKMKFGNGATADLYATFDVDKNLYTEAEIWFEDGTKLLSKEYIHPINTIRTYFDPVLIFKAGGVRWEEYFDDKDKKHPDYWKTAYEGQLEFVRKQATGEGKYDAVDNDVDGLGMETNIKVHEIIDAVLEAGGFEKKKGAE